MSSTQSDITEQSEIPTPVDNESPAHNTNTKSLPSLNCHQDSSLHKHKQSLDGLATSLNRIADSQYHIADCKTNLQRAIEMAQQLEDTELLLAELYQVAQYFKADPTEAEMFVVMDNNTKVYIINTILAKENGTDV